MASGVLVQATRTTEIERELEEQVGFTEGVEKQIQGNGMSMIGGVRRALVTGAGGLLGRAIVDVFQSGGWEVTALTRGDLDISKEETVKSAVSACAPEMVINCAAATDVDRCERDRQWAFSVNESGPGFLAEACAENRAALVHVSTDYVFNGEKEGPYTQDDEPDPLSVYGASKLAGELAVSRRVERAYVVRTSWVFGAGGKNFGSKIIDYARAGKALKGIEDQISIPTYAPDLAKRILEVSVLGVPGLYHLTNSEPTSWLTFSRVALELAGMHQVKIAPATRAELGQPARRPKNSAMECLLSARLGLTPMRSWREALRDFVGNYYAADLAEST